jgi:uncharacterized membrane protein (DUF106 family)
MSMINALLRFLFDASLAPFRELPPLVSLVPISLLAAIGMLLVFKATSDQQQLAAVRRRIHAGLFEIRLFNDDLRAILRAQGDILRHNVTYVRLSLVPMLWIIVPLFFVVAQLQFHYAYGGLKPGQTALVKVALKAPGEGRAGNGAPAGGGKPAVSLEAPEGLLVETPPVWIPSLGEMAWRIRAERPGGYALRVRVGEETETKSVRVSDAVVRRSPVRVEPGFLKQLIYPAEAPLPASSRIRSIALNYSPRDVEILGWGTHWLVVFFVLSIVFAFALRNRLKVTL